MATYMSASLCLMAWNEAICRPKAKRPSAYSRAMSSAACAPPTCSKATSTAARSSSRSTSGQPWPAAPRGSAAAPSSAIRACERVGSTVATARARDPGPGEIHQVEAGAAPSAARGERRSRSRPRRRPSPGPWCRSGGAPSARVARLAGVGTRGPSASARQPMASPCAMRGSQRFFCASLPASSSASRGQVDRGGERRGGEAPAQLLRDHAELEVAEAGAAVGLGDGGAHPAHLAHALPELARRRARRPRGCGGRGSTRRARRGTSAPAPGAISGRPRSRSSWREDHTKGACHAGARLSESVPHPHPALSPTGRGGEDGGGHARDGGGALRGPEAGGGGGRGGDGSGAARGARALGGQRRLPQRPARDHRGLSASAAGGAGARGGRGGGEDRGGRRDGEGGRSRLLELYPVLRALRATASAGSPPCARCATSRAGSCSTAPRASAGTASRSTTSCRSRATRPTRCCPSRA